MSWLYLMAAIVFEIGGTTGMKASHGFTRPVPSVVMGVCYTLCFYFVTLAVKKLPLSVTYAVWSGVGTAITAVIGMTVFREAVSPLKIAALGLIILGVVLLNLQK